jgi:formiminotetrahydrofolate cyclodeaminase
VTGLADQTLIEFLEAVGSASPAPGGGSSSAVVAALAAGLVEMAAGIGGGDRERPRVLRQRALELAEAELSSYAPVLEALRLPREDPERSERLAGALLEGSRSPCEVAELAAEVAELGLAVAQGSSAAVRGDALAGVVLAEAATTAAARLVEINLVESGADDLVERARAARRRAAEARAQASSRPADPPVGSPAAAMRQRRGPQPPRGAS